MKKKRQPVPKTRAAGTMTESGFVSFVIGTLRAASLKFWKPRQLAVQRARTARGFYKCALCEQEFPTYVKVGEKRSTNYKADHISPVIDPKKGFTTWDDFILRLFVEVDGYQVLCNTCHKKKTDAEREVARGRQQSV